MHLSEREILRDAAILQVIAGELGSDHSPAPTRLAELARALNTVASSLITAQQRPARA